LAAYPRARTPSVGNLSIIENSHPYNKPGHNRAVCITDSISICSPKPVAELTTDELGRAYVDRLLTDGVDAVDAGQAVQTDADFFANLRQHVRMDV